MLSRARARVSWGGRELWVTLYINFNFFPMYIAFLILCFSFLGTFIIVKKNDIDIDIVLYQKNRWRSRVNILVLKYFYYTV